MTAYLNAVGLICALGEGRAEVSRKLFAADDSGMCAASGWVPERRLPVGAVKAELPQLPADPAAHQAEEGQEPAGGVEGVVEAAHGVRGGQARVAGGRWVRPSGAPRPGGICRSRRGGSIR